MNQQGEDLRIQLPHLTLVGDRQDQAPDGGGQSGAATGTQAALLRQRHEEVPAVGDEIVGKELAGEAVAMLHA